MSIVKNIKNLLSVRLALLCCLVGTAGLAQAENKAYINDFSIQSGETKTIILNLDTDLDGLMSLEGYIVMPTGLEVQNQGTEKNKKWIKYDNSRVSAAVAQMNPLTGQMNITGFGSLISSGTGSVATIVVKATEELADGSQITLSNFKGTDKDGKVVEVSSANATVSVVATEVKIALSIAPSSLCLLPGGEAVLQVQLENSVDLTGMQATVEVSEGLVLNGNIEPNEERMDGSFMANPKTMTFYFLNGIIEAGNGTILTVPVKAGDGFTGGSIKLTQIVGTTSSSKAYYPENAEVKVDLGDGIIVISKDGANTNVSVDETKGTPKAGIIADGLVAKSFNYQRTLPAGQACTVCLPYAPPTTGVKYYELASVEGNILTFTEVASPAAATPYVAVADAATDITPADIANVTLTQTVTGSAAGGYTLKGTLTGLTNAEGVAAGAYILQAGNVWKKVSSANTEAYIPPFRAYIVGGTAARLGTAFGETTAIESLRTVDLNGTVNYYDLSGRRISSPATKGVYIVNGKKILK